VERYVPGGGSKFVGAVVEEHAPMGSVQRMSGTVTNIDASRVSMVFPSYL
jgi:hypothetical protein